MVQSTEGAKSFLIRRYLPVFSFALLFVFLISHLHLLARTLGPYGEALFNESLRAKAGIPFFPAWEILFLAVPLIAVMLGHISLIVKGRGNFYRYSNAVNGIYTFYKFAGFLALLFLPYHIYQTRILSAVTQAPMEYLWLVRLLRDPISLGITAGGSLAASYFIVIGLWFGIVRLGLLATDKARKNSLILFHLLWLAMVVVMALVLGHFVYQDTVRPPWLNFIYTGIRDALFRL